MKVYMRRNGRFVVDYLEDGVRHQKSFTSEEQANAFVKEREALEHLGLTVHHCLLAFIDAHPEMAERRKKEYLQLFSTRNGIALGIENKEIDKLSRTDLEIVRIAGRKQKLTPQTINYKTGLLKAMFNWATELELIADNPWRKYPSLKAIKKSREAPAEDFLRIYNELPDWAQWACRTCIALCLRPGNAELFALNWSDFNWDAGTVKVYMPKTKRSKLVYPPKGYLLEARERYKQSQVEYVIPSLKGKRAYAVYFCVVWQRTREKLGILDDVKPYCMRHLAASGEANKGVSNATVAAKLGHASPTTTQQYYLHTNDKELARTAELSMYNDFFTLETEDASQAPSSPLAISRD